MKVFRIVKTKTRGNDLSGTGSFQVGGRWNSKGTYMLYTSENSSLALLENMVHYDRSLLPPRLYIMELEMDPSPVYTVKDAEYPANWLQPGLIRNQQLGDKWMREQKFLAIKIKSAVNVLEYNYLLNPRFPDYGKLVKVKSLTEIKIDERLIKNV
jgi:RES domain-containing protein